MSIQVEPVGDFSHYKEFVSITSYPAWMVLPCYQLTLTLYVASGDAVVLAFMLPISSEYGPLLSILSQEAEQARAHGVEVRLFEVDPYRLEDVAEECKIKRTPAVIAFKNCQESGRVTRINPQQLER
ncbi:hypothetical protein DL93DRAFT_2184454 [Clavulina sp. PMI_390]|nr:hypothetical protein DL93DRAFT_2184454 [Clavulina sp. PMI_390]